MSGHARFHSRFPVLWPAGRLCLLLALAAALVWPTSAHAHPPRAPITRN